MELPQEKRASQIDLFIALWCEQNNAIIDSWDLMREADLSRANFRVLKNILERAKDYAGYLWFASNAKAKSVYQEYGLKDLLYSLENVEKDEKFKPELYFDGKQVKKAGIKISDILVPQDSRNTLISNVVDFFNKHYEEIKRLKIRHSSFSG